MSESVAFDDVARALAAAGSTVHAAEAHGCLCGSLCARRDYGLVEWITFLGTGISLVLGEDLSKAGAISLLPTYSIPILTKIPVIGPIFFTDQSVMVYIGYLLIPVAWYYINRTRPGLHLRAVGENPSAADALGINVYRLRYFYVFVGGMLAGLAGATISLAISPGWFSELTTAGQGWIAVGLVIFAQWDPVRAAFGAYVFGALRRLILDIQGPTILLGFQNPF